MILITGLKLHCTIQCASYKLKVSLSELLANKPTSKAEVSQLEAVSLANPRISHTTGICFIYLFYIFKYLE